MTETPYNGIDDDCNDRTRDVDLDGDGQNADTAPFNPGMDCNDNDPTIFAGAAEVCGDGIDNDCDTEIDERDCADLLPPQLSFLSPMDGATINGQVLIRVQVDDDVGATEMVLRANNVEVGRVPLEPTPSRTVEVTLSTTSLREGSIVLSAEAVDLKERVGSTVITVTVDNSTPPEITILSPVAGVPYGGYLTAMADVTDPSGVDLVEFEVDGVVAVGLTAPPFEHRVMTSSLADGAHDIIVRAFDANGSQTTRRVVVTVDNTPPNLRFVEPIDQITVSGVFPVTVTATDASALSAIVSEGRTSQISPLTYMVDTATVVNGPLVLRATTMDTALIDDGAMLGNVSTTTVTVNVNNIDPTPVVRFVTPLAGYGVLGQTPLQVNVTSPVGNPITGVDFTVGGRPAGTVTTTPYILNYDFSVHTGTVAIVATATDNATPSANAGSAQIVVTVVPRPTFRVADTAKVPGNLGTAGFAVADVDGDMVMDVVVGGSEINVFTGTISPSTGLWSPRPPRQIVRATSIDVRVADVNLDTFPDLISLSGNKFDVYLNTGNGTFGTATAYTLPQSGMTAFEVADLDGDQDPDLVVVGGTTSGVVGHVYLLDAGVYAFAQNLGGDAGAVDVAIGDLDADLDLDVVVGRAGNGNDLITIYLNGGIGNFGAGRDTPTLAPPEAVAIGDVTGEGRADVVVALPTIGGFQVMPVTMTSPFTIIPGPGVASSMGQPRSLAIGPVVGTPTNDVVIGSFVGNGVQVFAAAGGTQTGFTLDESYIMTPNLRNAQLVDLDGDGNLDIVATGTQDGVVAYARNLGNGKFMAAIGIPAPVATDNMGNQVILSPRAVATGNVWGDPSPDIIVTYDGGAQLSPQMTIYEEANNQFTLSAAANLPATITPPQGLAVGGQSLTTGYEYIAISARAAIPNMEATAIFVEPAPPNFFVGGLFSLDRPDAVAIGDVDNDGSTEAVFALNPAGPADGSIAIDLDLSGVRGPFLVGEGASSVTVGNLDSDPMGMLDYAVANSVSENVTVQIWNGTGFTTTVYNAPAGLGDITTGFVGSDAFLDIVGVAQNVIFVLEGDPAFGFRTPVTFPAGQQPRRIVGGDFNQDGLFDVMVLNNSDRASLLLARPQGGFFPPITFGVGDGPIDFTADDIDGDGKDDIIVVNSGVRFIMVMYNNADTL